MAFEEIDAGIFDVLMMRDALKSRLQIPTKSTPSHSFAINVYGEVL